jgi:hypothetical protein
LAAFLLLVLLLFENSKPVITASYEECTERSKGAYRPFLTIVAAARKDGGGVGGGGGRERGLHSFEALLVCPGTQTRGRVGGCCYLLLAWWLAGWLAE